MKVYISGPMSGLPDHNYKAFDEARKWVEALGHEVVSPADLGRQLLAKKPKATWRDFMANDIPPLIECDAIFMLPGWRDSRGANIERTLAVALGLKVIGFGLQMDNPPSAAVVSHGIAGRIARCRRESCIGVADLAVRLGVNANRIKDIEADRGRCPDLDELVSMAMVFDVSVDWLLGLCKAGGLVPDSPTGDGLTWGLCGICKARGIPGNLEHDVLACDRCRSEGRGRE